MYQYAIEFTPKDGYKVDIFHSFTIFKSRDLCDMQGKHLMAQFEQDHAYGRDPLRNYHSSDLLLDPEGTWSYRVRHLLIAIEDQQQ